MFSLFIISGSIVAVGAIYVWLIASPSFFGFVQSTYVTTNIASQTRAINVAQDRTSTAEEHDPWADAICKQASKFMQRQAWFLETFAGIVILLKWIPTYLGLKAMPPTARQIMSTHKSFTLAQQQAAADAVKAEKQQKAFLAAVPAAENVPAPTVIQ